MKGISETLFIFMEVERRELRAKREEQLKMEKREDYCFTPVEQAKIHKSSACI